MFKERLSRIFSSRIFYIVFSILASFSLWLYVEYTQTGEVVNTVGSVPVTFVSMELLEEKNLIITDISDDAVTVDFYGKASGVMQISRTNTTAIVDLSKITQPNVYELDYTFSYPDNSIKSLVSRTEGTPRRITVTVESMEEKTIPVRGKFTGDVAEDFTAERIVFSPETITVYGAKSDLDQISAAWATVDDRGLFQTLVKEEVPIQLIDDDGEVLNLPNVELSQETVTATITVQMVKTVPLSVTLNHGRTTNSGNTVCTISPESITLSGDVDILSAIDEISLGTIDMTSFNRTKREGLVIPIPNNLSNISGITDAIVTVTVSGLESRTIPVSNIEVLNVPEGYDLTLVTQSLDIMIRGTPEAVDAIGPQDIRVVADLSELENTAGTFTESADVIFNDPARAVDAIGDFGIIIRINKE